VDPIRDFQHSHRVPLQKIRSKILDLDAFRAVAIEMLRSLDPGDRFEILAFSSDVRRLMSGPASGQHVEH
jgi:hypothetical protein